ncbi:MFS transporter [Streptomyces yaizuensis]|uniref:MFS transporter n=1 Tax=Streptomyces yaizuensis TaxID=2989713 RepID=A0ABQ5P7F5_9ACTN|nr:MFS transporter [Streptomyces sp. YSPA8]GLF98515.1 MFS transporter [Streptomyces sp. YSPA8]
MREDHGPGLRDTLRSGGWAICLLAVPLVVMEQLGREATSTLAPDIQAAFGVGDAVFVAAAGFTGVALTLGGLPMAWLAVRVNRKHLVVASAAVGTLSLVGAGLAQNMGQLFAAYACTGLAAAYSNPVFGSLIADAYPAGGRGRIFALHATATPIGQAVGPAFAGSVAALAGGGDAWRWAYLALAVPYALLTVAAAVLLKDPGRGAPDHRPGAAPVGVVRAFRLMTRVRTFLFMCLGIGVLGLALFTVPVQMSLLLGEEYGFDAFERGLLFSLVQLPVIAAMVAGGRQFDRSFRSRPERTVTVAGAAILGFGAITAGGIWLRPAPLLIACHLLASVCAGLALVSVSPLVAAVTSPRMRAQAFAILPVFTFLMGGFLGSVFAGFLSDAHGPRTAISAAVAFSALVGGVLFLRARGHVRGDAAAAAGEPPVPAHPPGPLRHRSGR